MKTFAILVVACIAAAQADPVEQMKSLEKKCATALKCLKTLKLTKEQMTALLPICGKIREGMADYNRKRLAILQEQEVAFSEFKLQDITNMGFTKDVEKRTSQASAKEKSLNEEYLKMMDTIDAEICKVLTSEQAAILNPPSKPEENKLKQELKQLEGKEKKASGITAFFTDCYLPELFGKVTGVRTEVVEACGCSTSEARVKELRRDINLLNLINGMNFSPEQIKVVIASAPEQAEYSDTGIDAYTELLRIALVKLESGIVPSDKEIKQTNSARYSVQRPPKKKADTAAVYACLSDAQKQTLFDYKSCLIPPKNLKDPVRVGQAHDDSAAVKQLERIRKIPAAKYDAATVIGDFAKGLELSEEAKSKMFSDGPAFLEKVRALTSEEFQIQSSDIAKEATAIFNRKEYLEAELKKLADREKVIKIKIAGTLLNPAAIPILDIRLKQLTEVQNGELANLDAIAPAESCERQGGCAIPENKSKRKK